MAKSKYDKFGKVISGGNKIDKKDIEKSKGRKPINSIQGIRDAYKRLTGDKDKK